MTHEMKLPNGDTLREGDYAKLRNGEVVGPLRAKPGHNCFYWDSPAWGAVGFNMDGTRMYSGKCDDIIARATNPRTAKAVAQLDGKDDGWGPWTSDGTWDTATHDVQFECVDGIHRVRKRLRKPAEPREFWIVGGCEAYDTLQEAQDACSNLMWPSIVHVREVTE